MDQEALGNLHFEFVQPFESYPVNQWKSNHLESVNDLLAEEVPVALVYNGISHVVMLATPQDLEDFALGFSVTEGIVVDVNEVYDIEVRVQPNGIELHLNIASERFVQLKERRRSMAGRTGCGLCGAESLSQVFREPVHKRTEDSLSIRSDSLLKAHQEMYASQPIQHATGATHACAWADADGNVRLVREDVGRHNALDKLIGALLKEAKTGGVILTTSRASYEMVQKVVMAGHQVLSAISAPTGLAVRMANQYHLTLLGFVRDQQYVIYSHPHRIKHP